MLPPWEAFPGSTSYTQGYQEMYFCEWQLWFAERTAEEKDEYAEKYPQPDSVLVSPEEIYG